ncbi:MAG: NusG domain II-containing protein [Deferrisomatales bacterium]|nr:NusG domain II-containing protein [Deferrisomatales bacterium]
MRRRAFTVLDGLLLVGLLALHVYLWPAWGTKTPAAVQVVSVSGVRTEPLAGSRELAVDGPLGTTRVRLDAGAVRVEDSPCPDKLCVAAGPVTRPGQVVACLPNRVALRVVGADEGGVDAVGR